MKRRRSSSRHTAGPEHAPEHLADAIDQSIERNADDRAFQAYRYFVLGYTYREIAKQCGYASHTTAIRAVKRAREQAVVRDTRALVARQADRIEMAVATVMQAIESWPVKDKLWAVDRLTPLLKRESELMGLDTPREVAPAGPPQVKLIRQGGNHQGGNDEPLAS